MYANHVSSVSQLIEAKLSISISRNKPCSVFMLAFRAEVSGLIMKSCGGVMDGLTRLDVEMATNVFSPWNQMAEALSTAASICAVRAFGCSSVPAVLLFPQATRAVVAARENATVVRLANAAMAMDKIFASFIVVIPILCLSAEKVAS